MPTIDLNSDLAEGFGAYRCGDDDAMLNIVTSANVGLRISCRRSGDHGAHPTSAMNSRRWLR